MPPKSEPPSLWDLCAFARHKWSPVKREIGWNEVRLFLYSRMRNNSQFDVCILLTLTFILGIQQILDLHALVLKNIGVPTPSNVPLFIKKCWCLFFQWFDYKSTEHASVGSAWLCIGIAYSCTYIYIMNITYMWNWLLESVSVSMHVGLIMLIAWYKCWPTLDINECVWISFCLPRTNPPKKWQIREIHVSQYSW